MMIRIHTLEDIPHGRPTAITIGTFDGMHRGHRVIIDELVATARRLNALSTVITFHPHPQAVLRRTGESVPLLTTIEERAELLLSAGVDVLAVVPFTRELADTPWRAFCEMLIERAGLLHFVVGHDHAFGRNREGNAEALAAYGAERGFGVTEIGPLLVGSEAISSTKIRRALLAGDVTAATEYLGRMYSLQGVVVRGDGRGRALGIPTANIQPLDAAKLIPANGVYCVRLDLDDERLNGMANVGVRPTFTDGQNRTIEVNLFDFDDDIYERVVRLHFRKFVRSEQKFTSGAAFLEQLGRDRDVCRNEGTIDRADQAAVRHGAAPTALEHVSASSDGRSGTGSSFFRFRS